MFITGKHAENKLVISLSKSVRYPNYLELTVSMPKDNYLFMAVLEANNDGLSVDFHLQQRNKSLRRFLFKVCNECTVIFPLDVIYLFLRLMNHEWFRGVILNFRFKNLENLVSATVSDHGNLWNTRVFSSVYAYSSILKLNNTVNRYCNLPYRTGQSVDLTVIGNPVFTLSRDLSFPYHVINWTKGLNSAYLLFHRLQYMYL